MKATNEYCKQLAADFGLSSRIVLNCLAEEPAERAYDLCAWAQRTSSKQADCDQALKNYAKKHRIGIYRPEPEEELSPATRIKRASAPPMDQRAAMARSFLARMEA